MNAKREKAEGDKGDSSLRGMAVGEAGKWGVKFIKLQRVKREERANSWSDAIVIKVLRAIRRRNK